MGQPVLSCLELVSLHCNVPFRTWYFMSIC